MTKNEEKAIKWIKNVRDNAVIELSYNLENKSNVHSSLCAERKEKTETILKMFEELKQYRTIGTVEEIKKVVQFLSLDNDNGIIEDLRLLNQYMFIGTVEECREAMKSED